MKESKDQTPYLNQAISQAKYNRPPAIYSATKKGQFIVNLNKESQMQASAAYDFFFSHNTQTTHVQYYDYFEGLFKTIIFDNKTGINKILDSEKAALENLRIEYSKLLIDLTENYTLKNNEETKSFSELKSSMESWQNNTKDSLTEFTKQKETILTHLEKLYSEKLRLESPAQYWNALATTYTTYGNTWKWCAIITSIIYVGLLSFFLYTMPEKLFPNIAVFNFNNLKGTIIFALIASVGIYLIRLFVKLATSDFHLARDANERFHLTHVYLSLLDKNAASADERKIVLQSIFSRADTGLLKGDSSPAFPDGLVSQLMKNIK